MAENENSKDLLSVLWAGADILRGKMDANEYKNYLLGIVFYKYLSDTFLTHVYDLLYNKKPENMTEAQRAYEEIFETEDAEELLEDIKESYHYTISPDLTYTKIAEAANNNSFQRENLQKAFNNVEQSDSIFANLFADVDLYSTRLGAGEQKQSSTIAEVVKTINEANLLNHEGDVLGDAYEYLIGQFASETGKKAGEFYTPQAVSQILTRVAIQGQEDKQGLLVYDAAMGSGSLLLNAKKYSNKPDYIRYFGQELSTTTYNLARMNMFLHGVDDARIWQGDTLFNPQNIEDDKLMKFQVVVANPPFSLDKWDSGFLSNAGLDAKGKKQDKMTPSMDIWKRFDWGVPPSSKGDYAFVLHMLHSLDAENGRMAVVLPHGVLFRGASEGKIRKALVDSNLLDAVIGLPANLFYGTGIPACILVFRTGRTRDDVLFIDASGESNYEKGKNQNILRPCDIKKIVETYEARENVDKYSYLASRKDIADNDYNLNIPRYVDTFEEEELVDIDEVKQNIAAIEAELAEVQAQMAKYLVELGL